MPEIKNLLWRGLGAGNWRIYHSKRFIDVICFQSPGWANVNADRPAGTERLMKCHSQCSSRKISIFISSTVRSAVSHTRREAENVFRRCITQISHWLKKSNFPVASSNKERARCWWRVTGIFGNVVRPCSRNFSEFVSSSFLCQSSERTAGAPHKLRNRFHYG